jgi:translation initiation factor 3 subunit B
VEVIDLKGGCFTLPLRLSSSPLTDAVLDFSWESKGERFAVVTSDDPNLGVPGMTTKTGVSFYELHKAKNEFKLLRE